MKNEDIEFINEENMDDEGVEFIEDKSILKPMESVHKIPEKGFEGWFYRNFPGKNKSKKLILISIIIAMFGASLIFLILAKYEQEPINTRYSEQTSN